MFIQGHLQDVFDVLYSIGVIDPILKMDWAQLYQESIMNQGRIDAAIHTVNKCQGDRSLLKKEIQSLDELSVYYLAMEVAREYAEFASRKTLH